MKTKKTFILGPFRMTVLSLMISFVGQAQLGSARESFSWEVLSGPLTILEAGEGFTKVTDAYGKLVVREGRFESESAVRPWSSWWYPYWRDDFFEDAETARSILWRYDRFVEKLAGMNPKATDFEKDNLYFPDQARWSGRCDAWALASLMEPEPTKEVVIRGIRFRVRDQKALLIKMYEKVEGNTTFGQRYNGEWDSVYQDIFPDQFHRFLQVELFKKKHPFIMDYDSGIEVWNSPVWKSVITIKKDPDNAQVVHVKNIIYTASPFVENMDFVGTEGVIRIYSYDLHGGFQENGDFVVTHGNWTGNSVKDHPDFIMPFPKSFKHSSLNLNLKEEYIRKIIHEAAQAPVAIRPEGSPSPTH